MGDDLFRSFNVTLDAGPEIPPVVANSPQSNGYAIIEFSGPNFVAYKLFVNNGVEVTQVVAPHLQSPGISNNILMCMFPVLIIHIHMCMLPV